MPIDQMKAPKYKTRRVCQVDRDTGEIISEGLPVLQRMKPKHYEQDFALMFLEAMGKVCENRKLKGEEFRAWVYLVTKMKMQNIVTITQKQIAESLGIQKSHISKYIKSMVEAGVLEKGEKKGNSYQYHVPKELFWRGSGEIYKKEKDAKIVSIDRERMKLLSEYKAENGYTGV